MRATVKLKKGQLDYFRTLARDSKLEIEAYLLGEIKSADLTIVRKFAYTTEYSEQSTISVAWKLREYRRVEKLADKHGWRIVGSIHSHPSWDAVMSPADYKAAITDQLRIVGICSTNGRKTRVRFWVPESSLPCEIDYE